MMPTGEIVMRGAEVFALYVVVRALYEGYKTNISDFDDAMHKRAHIAALGAIVAYNIFDLYSFIHFEEMNVGPIDYTISFFNLLSLNVLWLFIIDHFKQERKGTIEKTNWFELFKF